jgi:hypothetical protein
LILGIFQLIPIFFLDLILFGRKRFFSVIDFPGATGLGKGQGQGARLGSDELFEMKWATRGSPYRKLDQVALSAK